MPTYFSPRQLELAALEGFRRTRIYRAARMMYLKQYVGQYYHKSKGITGNEPVNLIFNTVRVLTPNLVMNNPKNEVHTDFIPHQDYAFLLGRGINSTEERIKFADTLRAGIVSAFFAFGLFKTGIAESGQLLYMDDINIDPGSVYTDMVDLDNLCIDPTCTEWDHAAFLGDKIRVPRQNLLDNDNYDHDLIVALPQSGSLQGMAKDSKFLSQKQDPTSHMNSAMDYVDVVELWVPSANAVVTIPDPSSTLTDKYLSIRDYYGPKEGPYTKLSLTLPVPNNALPVAPISVWYDLHMMSNKIFKKTFEQADRQKDLAVFNPSATDQAEDMRDAMDGEMVPGDPDSVKVVSYGGQNRQNEAMLGQLQTWYNYVAGNPDQIAGIQSNADTATQATILQGNASIAMSDMRDIVYKCAAEIGGKIGWYLHYDPFIELPITIRSTGGKQQQLWLTPEQRRGEFYKYTFKVTPKSMNNLDSNVRSLRIIQFCTNVIPSAVAASMQMTQMGVKFNLPAYLTRIAEEMEIGDWVQDLFEDPEWEARIEHMMMAGPQNMGKVKTGQSPSGPMQNGQSPMAPKILDMGQQMNKDSQMGAAQSQQSMRSGA